MKQRFSLWFLLMFFTFSTIGLRAQCTPDPGFTGTGIVPDTTTNMAPACVGIPYAQTFTINPPPDTVIAGFLFTVNFIRIDNVVGLPAGFSYACNPINCTFPGGGSGCAIVTGTPGLAQVGVYPLTIQTTIQIYNGTFGTVTQTATVIGYRLKIGGGMNITTNSTNAGCGISDGSVWATVTGGASPLTYLWNSAPPSANDTVINLPAGTYQVNVTDNYGCADSAMVGIGNPNSPVIDTITGTNNSCFGDSMGTATPTISLGTAPYTYTWSNGDTTATIGNLPAGSYGLLVTDSNNCTSLMETIIITEPGAISASMSSNSETCLGCNDGSATATPSGGTPPYTYLWSNSGVTSTINGIPTGMYYVTITDSLGCTYMDSVMVNSTAGLQEYPLFSSIIIYPNPVSDFVTIQSGLSTESLGKLEVLDIHGRVMTTAETTHSKYSMDIQHWPIGMYLVRIYRKNSCEAYKFVKN